MEQPQSVNAFCKQHLTFIKWMFWDLNSCLQKILKTWDVERPELISIRFWSSWVLRRQENDLLEASSQANRLEKSEEFNLERYGYELEAKLDLLKNAIQ